MNLSTLLQPEMVNREVRVTGACPRCVDMPPNLNMIAPLVLVVGLAMVTVLLLPIFDQAPAQSVRTQEGGIIEYVSSGNIHVKGSKGQHIFFPLRFCSWCEPGRSVLITYESVTRATLQPAPVNPRLKAIPILIVKDGRSMR